MAHHNTILSQIVTLFPRHEFESLAKIHHVGQKFSAFNRWSQFLAMVVAQLSGRKSLLFFSLLNRCQLYTPKNRFKFDGKIYLLDSTVINLCLSISPWATFRKTKGAIKLHFGLDADGYPPVFMDMTKGKVHESTWAKALSLPSGSTVVFVRDFNDYGWYQSLTGRHIVFVTRLKRNSVFEPLEKRRGRKGQGVRGDRRIRLKDMDSDLHIVDFIDSTTGKTYRFLTNSFSLKANIIADLYKERWKIELCFKWIKHNLRVKTFLGSSPNAVLTQLWIALCVYLLLTFLKFKAKLGCSITEILRLLQLNIFERRPLADLLKPPERCQPFISPQLLLWAKL